MCDGLGQPPREAAQTTPNLIDVPENYLRMAVQDTIDDARKRARVKGKGEPTEADILGIVGL